MKMTLIRRIVAEHYGLTIEQLLQDTLRREISVPRQVAMYFCHRLTDSSLTQIARFLGRSDHTTVIHAIQKILTLMQNNTQYLESLEQLEKKIRGCDAVDKKRGAL